MDLAGQLQTQIVVGSNTVSVGVPDEAESAHADQEALYHWVESIKSGGKLKKVFAVQGEDGPALALVQLLRDNLGVDAEAPMIGDSVEL